MSPLCSVNRFTQREKIRDVDDNRDLFFFYYGRFKGCMRGKGRMPKGARLDSSGTIHHVMVRGIGRRNIVTDDEDRERFVFRLDELSLDTETAIYACGGQPCPYPSEKRTIRVAHFHEAAFQIVLKRRPHMLRIASLNVRTSVSPLRLSLPDPPISISECVSEALENVYATISRGRSGQGSLPCSTPLQNRAGTSPVSPHIRRLPPTHEAGSSNRR